MEISEDGRRSKPFQYRRLIPPNKLDHLGGPMSISLKKIREDIKGFAYLAEKDRDLGEG